MMKNQKETRQKKKKEKVRYIMGIDLYVAFIELNKYGVFGRNKV